MKSALKFIFIVVGSVIIFATLYKPPKAVLTSSGSGATLTTTDVFGNETKCETIVIGETYKTFCN